MSLASFYNTCWMTSCYREARAFARDSINVGRTQAALLEQIVSKNRDTQFGRKHDFASVKTVADFQRAVPLSIYDDYRDSIERIADGQANVLTADRVRLLEPTGGSTSGEKLIPYTSGLRQSFQRAIRVWIWDLFSKRPAVRQGRSYWSISPIAHVGRRTKAGIPIGFDDDTAYLSFLERFLVQRTIIAPRELAQCPTVAAAQYATLFYLLRAPDLALISVWSPTFLTQLLDMLWVRWESLLDDLASGQISNECVDGPRAVTQRHYPQLNDRAEHLRHAFRGAKHISECIPAIWPSLKLVSCWADGPSLAPANHLRQYLGAIEIQPKGLLATEAVVTVPLISLPAPALAIRSNFFEFLPAEPNAAGVDAPLLADELVEGACYQVVVTNPGGLYRYRSQDEVEVAGFFNKTPLLRFVGKTDEISDLVGEKLSAAHVEMALRSAFRELRISPSFSQLRVERSSTRRYVLQVALTVPSCNRAIQAQLCETVERGLCSNPGYRYARALGQLAPLSIELLDRRQADSIDKRRTDDRIAAGQRLGDIKPATICNSDR
jgi:hypothetical protein